MVTTARAIRRTTAVLALTVALGILGGGVAWAHPGLRPAEVTAGETSDLELVTEHDCDPSNGEPSPTTLVAIQVPPQLATAEPLPLEGWQTSTETDDSGRTTVIEWTVAEGEQPETPPTLPLRVTADTTDETTEVELVVLQECTTGSYVWGGGDPDEPPVRLTVAPGTYTPPSPSPSTSPAPTAAETAGATPEPATTPSSEPTGDDGTMPDEDGQSSSMPAVLLVITALIVAGGVAVLVYRRRGKQQ